MGLETVLSKEAREISPPTKRAAIGNPPRAQLGPKAAKSLAFAIRLHALFRR
jgi:hypothetical protein